MNVRYHLKCDVCSTVTLLRVQVGWLPKFPLRVHCGKCGILISGYFEINQAVVSFKETIKNAEVINEEMASFYLEASGELIMSKLKPVLRFEDTIQPPPFFRALWSMSDENGALDNKNYDEFRNNVIQFLDLIENGWPLCRRINELWINGNHQYLPKEVNDILDPNEFPMNSPLECLRGVNRVNFTFFSPLINIKRYNEASSVIKSELKLIVNKNHSEVIKFLQYLSLDNLFTYYHENMLKQLDQFTRIFPYIIPVFSLEFYKNLNISNLVLENGITTASFEDVKQFYLDSYEFLVDLMKVIVCLNNIKYRGRYDQMESNPQFSKITTLDKYEKSSKANRLSYINRNEAFSYFVSSDLDNKLRNAVGHNSYKYDGISQNIIYRHNNTDKEISLLEFCVKCWGLFLELNNLRELLNILQQAFLHFNNPNSSKS